MDRYFVDFLNFETILPTEFTLELHLLDQMPLWSPLRGIIMKRQYKNEADLQAMIALTNKRATNQLTDFPSMVDLQEILGMAERQADAFLWEDTDGKLLGFAFLLRYETAVTLTYELAPNNAPLAKEMIAWAEAEIASGTKPVSLKVTAWENDVEKIALLTQLGFEQQAGYSVTMERPLTLLIPPAHLPNGYTMRPLAGEAEVDAWVTLHQAAWGTQNMKHAYRLSMMNVPEYDPAMDLVAVEPDGSLAGYCMCTVSEAENELSGQKVGYTDPIATHPDYQRRGIANALMLQGLRLLQERGLEFVRLGTSGGNVGMRETAVSVGFRITKRKQYFIKLPHSTRSVE